MFFTLVMVIATLNNLFVQTALAKYYLFVFNMVILAVLVFVIRILMTALGQSRFFAFGEDQLVTATTGRADDPAHRTEKEHIVERLLTCMQSDKPYLEPELSLAQLAAQLSLKPRVLSEALNDVRRQNFFDFINRYRIEEAARLLTSPKDEKLTVLEVLYQVGFNSKSSFNTLFKKYMGITPTEFRRKQQD
jgi:AraC-like DNA-binding protein